MASAVGEAPAPSAAAAAAGGAGAGAGAGAGGKAAKSTDGLEVSASCSDHQVLPMLVMW